MVLLGVTEEKRELTLGPMESKGDLKFKFVDAGATFPMIMQNLDDPIPKVISLTDTCGRDSFPGCAQKDAISISFPGSFKTAKHQLLKQFFLLTGHRVDQTAG